MTVISRPQSTALPNSTRTASRWPRLPLLLAVGLVSGCAQNLEQAAPGGTARSVAGGGASTTLAQTAPVQKRPVKIAMLLPFAGMGPTAIIAKGMKQAGEMALFELDRPDVQLMTKDTRGTSEGAAAAATAAIAEGAEIIVGPLFSAAVAGAAGPARQANVPVVAFSNDRKVAGNGVYLMSYMPEAEVERIVSFAISRGKRRFVALIPADGYGVEVEQAFRAAVARGGGAVIALETYQPGTNALLEPAQRILDIIKETATLGSPVDAFFLPAGEDTLPSIGPMIAYAGIDTRQVQLLGTGAWDFPNIGRNDVLIGGWYPSADPAGWQDFSGRFAKTFGQAPPRIATQAYDAVSMTIRIASTGAAGTGQQGSRFTTQALTNPAGFVGVDGPVRLDANGLSHRGLAVLEVQRAGGMVIDRAEAAGAPAGRLAAGGLSGDGGVGRSGVPGGGRTGY
ncbi:MAG: penicillin-binding protein activator [Hyphomicrobiaceae bacterium]|nr:penicillin-binding protein activator [Hyphomicrobiaceae bacterium]